MEEEERYAAKPHHDVKSYFAVLCFSLEYHDLQELKLMPPKELMPLEMLAHRELVTANYFSQFY